MELLRQFTIAEMYWAYEILFRGVHVVTTDSYPKKKNNYRFVGPLCYPQCLNCYNSKWVKTITKHNSGKKSFFLWNNWFLTYYRETQWMCAA